MADVVKTHGAGDTLIRRRPAWQIVLSACIIVGTLTGLRQSMGLYLQPISLELNVGREPFSNAMAISNLVWGITAVIAGAVADKYGSGRVLLTCGIAGMGSYLALYFATGSAGLILSGFLLGVSVSTALAGPVGRAVPSEKRTAAIAAMGMAGGIGGFVAIPYVHLAMEYLGWKQSLLLLMATSALVLPLAWPLAGKPVGPAGVRSQTLQEAFAEALSHPSYWLLVGGFFVCGFHVAFYSVHLPAFVADKGMDPWVGVWALMAVGAANLLGTYLAGQSGKFVEKRIGLTFIYFMRIFAFLGILYLPTTPLTVIAISGLLGLFWLSTVPLTTTLVGVFFGTQWMSMLFGFVFFSHQVGAFVGLWAAGRLYDATKSYDTMWWVCIALAALAALLHVPIREKPVARLAT